MARRKGGLFLPLDVNFFDDPRIVRAGRDAAWLYLAMCLACKRLGYDGRIEPLEVDRLHITGWKRLIPALLREELIFDLNDGVYTIAAWLRHNMSQHKIEEKRAVDREYHAGLRRNRVGADSEPSRSAKGSREKEREVTDRADDCEHGVDRHASCNQCPSLRVVGDTA